MRREDNRGHFTLRLLLVLLILIVGTIGFAPMIISTGWGKSVVVQIVNKWSSYRLQADELKLSWMGGQTLEGIEVVDKSGVTVFRCQSLSTDASLWQLGVRHDVGTMKIVAPKVTVQANLGPAPSVAFIQAGFIPNLDFRPSFNYTGNLAVENGEVDLLSPGFDPAYFRSVSLDAQVPKTGPIRFFAQGTTEQGGAQGSFNISATLDAVLNVKATLFHFPVRGLAAAITGPAVDVNMDISGAEDAMQAAIDATSPQFSAHLKAGLSGKSLTLSAPGTVDFQVTSALVPGLKQPSTAHLDITAFQMPLDRKDQFSFKSTLALATLALESYTLQPLKVDITTDNFASKKFLLQFDSKQFQIPDVEFYWEQPYRFVGKDFTLALDLQKEIQFNLKAQLSAQSQLLAQGTIDAKTLTSQVNITAKQFPTALLDKFAGFPASGLLGNSMDLAASAQIQQGNGTVNLSLQSPTTRTAVKGTVTNGILTLNDDVYAQITPQFPHLHTRNPISVEIPAKGASIAVFPFSLSQINIPNMRIELGKVRAENQGNLNFAVGLLKLSQFGKGSDLNLWFAPIDLHIKNGVVDCERTEVLAENAYQVCFWGNVSLPQNRVDMVLGLTASCLKKAFGIKNLPEKYVLQIPIRGTLNDVQVDTSKASSKVAALLLWQQKSLAGGAVGGPAGAIFGELLDKLGPLPDEDQSAPPPKRPFPWEKESSKAEEQPKKKKHFRKDDKPLNQILQMLR